MGTEQSISKPRKHLTPTEKAQAGLVLIYEAILETLEHNPNGLSHADIARRLELDLSYHGGANYVSQTILHQLVYSGEVGKIGEAAQAIYRRSEVKEI
jgi:hypothetical protein